MPAQFNFVPECLDFRLLHHSFDEVWEIDVRFSIPHIDLM